jgi:S1-C subfamily serine protease
MDNYCGVGCRFANHPDGKLYVAEVHAWGGAAQSGSVFVGDVLNTVNGLPVFSSEDAESVTMCRPDTSVTLGIRCFVNSCLM